MNNINFCAKLYTDKSFYSLKQSDCENIYNKSKKLVEAPIITDMIGDDVVLSGRGTNKGDEVFIKIKDKNIPIITKGEVHAGAVLQQILIYTCLKNGIEINSSSPKEICKKIKEYIEKNAPKL